MAKGFFTKFLFTAATGLMALGAVYFSGIVPAITINFFTAGVSVFLGIPGVILILLIKLIM